MFTATRTRKAAQYEAADALTVAMQDVAATALEQMTWGRASNLTELSAQYVAAVLAMPEHTADDVERLELLTVWLRRGIQAMPGTVHAFMCYREL